MTTEAKTPRTIGNMSILDAKAAFERDIDKMQTHEMLTVHGAAFGRELLDLVVRYAEQQSLTAPDIAVLGNSIAEMLMSMQGAFDLHGTAKRTDSPPAMHYSMHILKTLEVFKQIEKDRAKEEGVSDEYAGKAAEDMARPPNLMN